jgi:ribosome assembly protein 1
VEVTATAKGERILACLGELHLEQSILDLKKMYCGKEIELRISDPIVEFGETTDWFDNEMDFEAFFNDPAPRLRQSTIPPYNEEEGLEHAKHGRVRAILSGRFAAIHLRAIPLTQNVSLALKERKVVEGSNEDLLQVGKALGFQKESTDAESVLKTLLESLCSLDDRGNAIVESQSLSNGSSVRGVISDNREVYVPRESDNLNEGGDENNGAEQSGLEDYNTARESIQKLGFGLDQAEEDVRPVDAAALHIWKHEMRGSAVAGFEMAARAGPICEEPVHGVMVVLEAIEVAVKAAESENRQYECTKRISGGMVVAALRCGIRCALL